MKYIKVAGSKSITVSNKKGNMNKFLYGKQKRGTRKTFTVHKLVAMAFIPNINNKPTINHINGIKTEK